MFLVVSRSDVHIDLDFVQLFFLFLFLFLFFLRAQSGGQVNLRMQK